jgi:hypothetical protein
MRLHLVADARHFWKWHSMRLIALGALAQGTVSAADTTGLSAHLAPWILPALSHFALVCILAAGVGRVIDQPTETPDVQGTGGSNTGR